jgi:DNA N-6-adenine-methyltransferase (Dam)
MNVQHLSRSDSWQTPKHIIQLVKQVLGEPIDLDPASSPEANALIGASRIITREENGLTSNWTGSTVYLNPPGGKTKNASNSALFWKKLMLYRKAGFLGQAIFMAFSAEALQTTQGKGCLSIGEFPFCIPSKRIKFISAAGDGAISPSHSNVIVYVPGIYNNTERFYKTFRPLGVVVNGLEGINI